jgi:plasmid stabilization system protein ParE
MRLVYLDSTRPDLTWYRVYYRSVFPAGSRKAAISYLNTIDLLMTNPYIGRSIGQDGLRKLTIQRTPFALFYRVSGDVIEIVRLWDQRANPEELGFHEEAGIWA